VAGWFTSHYEAPTLPESIFFLQLLISNRLIMVDRVLILNKVISVIGKATESSAESFVEGIALIGPEAALNSRQLVEVLLELEEFAEDDLGVEFDWTADSALSMTRSIMRTIGTLVDHLHGLTR
jgi:hypothetical protein